MKNPAPYPVGILILKGVGAGVPLWRELLLELLGCEVDSTDTIEAVHLADALDLEVFSEDELKRLLEVFNRLLVQGRFEDDGVACVVAGIANLNADVVGVGVNCLGEFLERDIQSLFRKTVPRHEVCYDDDVCHVTHFCRRTRRHAALA